MNLKKIWNNVWFELGVLSAVDLAFLITIIYIYGFFSENRIRWYALALFIIFLGIGILHTYHKKFEKSNLFLSKKGKLMMFVKTCLPYILQTIFFSECSLIIAWILMNLEASPK